MGSIHDGGKTKNAIEPGVNLVRDLSGLSATASRERIIDAINSLKNNKELKEIFNSLVRNVPYRLLSKFVPEIRGDDRIWDQKGKLIDYFDEINKKNTLPYVIKNGSGLKKSVVWDDDWAEMVKDNYLLIIEWIRSKKIIYLQNRNPGVPGIIYKLEPSGARDLQKVHKLWDAVMTIEKVTDIYSGNILNDQKYDIDHFIPWSYVAADELWNLIPSEKTVNISKSNNLPDWGMYFSRFLLRQVQLYESIHKSDQIRELFESCRKKNLNTLWAAELYDSKDMNRFKTMIDENMRPIYQAARIQGYSIWCI